VLGETRDRCFQVELQILGNRRVQVNKYNIHRPHCHTFTPRLTPIQDIVVAWNSSAFSGQCTILWIESIENLPCALLKSHFDYSN
jgi:hypothetical protein